MLNAAQRLLQNLTEAQKRPRCVFVTGMEKFIARYSRPGRRAGIARRAQLYKACAKDDFDEGKGNLSTLRLLRDSSSAAWQCDLSAHVLQLHGRHVLNSIVSGAAERSDVKQCDQLLALVAGHDRTAVEPFKEAVCVEYIICVNELYADLNSLLGRLAYDDQ